MIEKYYKVPSLEAISKTEVILTEMEIDVEQALKNPIMARLIDKLIQVEQSKIDGTYGMEDGYGNNCN